MDRIFAFVVAILLGGCVSTGAQVQSNQIQRAMVETGGEAQNCVASMHESDPYQRLKPKLSRTIDAKANTAKATPEEVEDLKAVQEYVTRCRWIILEMAGKVSGTYAAIYTGSFSRLDAITARLISRQITWGEYNIEYDTALADRRVQLTTELANVQRGLSTAHNAEIRRRQAALDAAVSNMPKQTNCTSFGGYINCTTY